jgi:hypothetical protein
MNRHRPFVWATWAALAILIGSSAGHAQLTTYAATATRGVERATVVAGTVLLPAGSRHDGATTAGSAWLAGHSIASHANAALAGSGATVSVSVARSTTAFTLTAVPESWATAWATLDTLIFDAPIDPATFDVERRLASTQLAFRAGSPVTDFQAEAFARLAPPSDPWARTPVGSLESLGVITPEDAEALRAQHYRRGSSVVAIVGADDDVSTPSGSRSPISAATPAWLSGDRTVLKQDVTSAWISVAYPVPSSIDRTTLEFLVDIIQDVLDPVPPDPERYSVDVRIVEAPGGTTVVAQIAVIPDAADRWEARTVNAVAALPEAPPTGEFFDWARRRFRSRRLLAEGGAEQSSARMAADLLRDGEVRDLDKNIWALTEAGVAAAFRSFGDARILRLGPDLGLSGR